LNIPLSLKEPLSSIEPHGQARDVVASNAGELFGRGKGSSGSSEPKLSEGRARDVVASKT
jgi:hypothetical protein